MADPPSDAELARNRARYEAWVAAKYGGAAVCPQCGSGYVATTDHDESGPDSVVLYKNYCFACEHRWQVEAPSAAAFGRTE